jgi:hypothetical protein
LTAAKAELQPKLDAVAAAREAAVAAEAAKTTAAEEAHKMARALEPVSFISRKTQRLYVRQAFQPVLEAPVMIQGADRPIGTHVFTAMERIDGAGDMRWTVVSMPSGHPDGGGEPSSRARGYRDRDAGPTSTDPSGEIAALDRITIPQDALDHIAEMAFPRSSLIISDEALSSETGKNTEFVVIMSDEPQGGIKFRRRGPTAEVRYQGQRGRQPYWPSPFAGP